MPAPFVRREGVFAEIRAKLRAGDDAAVEFGAMECACGWTHLRLCAKHPA